MEALSPLSVSSSENSRNVSPNSSCSAESAAALEARHTNCLTAEIAAYQEFYTKRVQSLERLKEKVAEDANGNRIAPADPGAGITWKFNQLQENMVALMEKDVTLMRQLLALGDTIEDLKSWQISPASSVGSLSETDTELPALQTVNGQYLVNNIQVTNSSNTPKLVKKQYFSRKNSVLRIPIPPRHRTKTLPSLGTVTDDVDDSSSGVSSMSRGSSSTNYGGSHRSTSTNCGSVRGSLSTDSQSANGSVRGLQNRDYQLNQRRRSSYQRKELPAGFMRRDDLIESYENKGPVALNTNCRGKPPRIPNRVKEVSRHESQASCDSGINLANGEVDREEVFV